MENSVPYGGLAPMVVEMILSLGLALLMKRQLRNVSKILESFLPLEQRQKVPISRTIIPVTWRKPP